MAENGKRSCLLIVDDDSTIRLSLQMALGKHYEVVSLPNGEGIIQELDSYKPNLLILDINMPGSDGFKICTEVRTQAKLRKLPILFMTARKDDKSFLRSLEAGGDSHITKPFMMSALKERIEYLLKSCLSS